MVPCFAALTFAFTAEDAIVRLSLTASARNVGRNWLGSLGASYFPSLGFDPVRPTRIQAVYVPGWIVDADVEAQVWRQTDGREGTDTEKVRRPAVRLESGGLNAFAGAGDRCVQRVVRPLLSRRRHLSFISHLQVHAR